MPKSRDATPSLPTYVSSFNNVIGNYWGGSTGYNYLDQGATIYSVAYYQNGAASGSYPIFSFTLQGTIPLKLRVGILADNTDSLLANGSALFLNQTVGGFTSASASMANSNLKGIFTFRYKQL